MAGVQRQTASRKTASCFWAPIVFTLGDSSKLRSVSATPKADRGTEESIMSEAGELCPSPSGSRDEVTEEEAAAAALYRGPESTWRRPGASTASMDRVARAMTWAMVN